MKLCQAHTDETKAILVARGFDNDELPDDFLDGGDDGCPVCRVPVDRRPQLIKIGADAFVEGWFDGAGLRASGVRGQA